MKTATVPRTAHGNHHTLALAQSKRWTKSESSIFLLCFPLPRSWSEKSHFQILSSGKNNSRKDSPWHLTCRTWCYRGNIPCYCRSICPSPPAVTAQAHSTCPGTCFISIFFLFHIHLLLPQPSPSAPFLQVSLKHSQLLLHQNYKKPLYLHNNRTNIEALLCTVFYFPR